MEQARRGKAPGREEDWDGQRGMIPRVRSSRVPVAWAVAGDRVPEQAEVGDRMSAAEWVAVVAVVAAAEDGDCF